MVQSKIEDRQLITAYIEGQEEALGVLLTRHKARIFSYIMVTIKNKQLAEDFFQDTFVKVIKTLKAGKYNEEGKFLPWVMRIAHNLMIDHFRKSKKMQMVKSTPEFNILDTLSGDELNSDELMERSQRKKEIKELISLLPDEQKEVIQLRMYYDMSFKEIGIYSNVSINTALGRMRYALINLRKFADEKHLSPA
ncbi:MAG: RNA polymerase sigma factor (sigma-70 family) [Saprospiraceae bacterium]|jgi:RNA polymerase sigma factor (sigma-70 family)